MLLIKTEIEFGTPAYHATIELRDEILRKPLNLSFTEEQLSEEYDSHHLAIYTEELILVGCLVFKPIDDKVIKMRQVAVGESMQRKGVGQSLVQFSEAFAKKKGYQTIELNARDVSIPFYEKLNYQKVGAEFEEVGISHFKMIKDLSTE